MSARDLEQVTRLLAQLDDVLPAARRAALRRAVDPLVDAYRRSGCRDAAVLAEIVALLQRYPAAYARLPKAWIVKVTPSPRRERVGPAKAKARRTTLRSSKGKKLYATRDSRGRIKDASAYRRALARDLRPKAKKAMGPKPRRPAMRRGMKKKGGGGRGPSAPYARPRTTPPRRRASKSTRGPRWIQARVFDLAAADIRKPTPAFRAQGWHEIEVIIAADQKGWLVARGREASESIDSMLEPGTHELTVVLFIPELGTHKKGTLNLPPSGPTPQPARFRFKAGKAETTLTAFVSIVHRGRVLQTAVLSGKVVADPDRASQTERITFQLQEVVATLTGLDQREPFHATLLMATGKNATTVATAVTQRPGAAPRSVPFRQPGIDGAAQKIRDILATVVTDESAGGALEANPARELLCQLAQEGGPLYEKIGQQLEKALAGRELSRLQLVQADPNAFIPMEFAYALPAPANGATLCRNWRGALAGKPCPDKFHQLDELDNLKVVCPSGFWGVSKVIERQVFAPQAGETGKDADFELRADPDAVRQTLPAIGSAVFCWSDKLDNTVVGTSADLLQKLKQATGGRVDGVNTWLEWGKAIRRRRPQLLVVMSHTVDGRLEIGSDETGDRRAAGQITERYVRKVKGDAPIVFLLGCTTAIAENQFESFVTRFREKGAAIVVGTITPVLGERSAAVVEAVIDELTRKRSGRELFGEVLRSARRKLLLEGKVTALCATSFGDASWYVS